MPSANELLRDAAIARQIDITLYTNGLVRKLLALLNQSDSELMVRLAQAIESYGAGSFSAQRLDSVMNAVRLLNQDVYQQVARALLGDVQAFAELEIDFQKGLLTKVPASALPVSSVPVDQVYAAVQAKPFQGRLLSEWAVDIEKSRMTRIRDAVRIGFVAGETIPEIVRKIRGTKANGYADGIIEIDRRSAESVARTAIAHTASVAREQMVQANADLVKAVQWVSTLDTRTTEICMVRDGLQYTTDHQPIGHKVPWLGGPGQAHWGCRSVSCIVLKSNEELGIDVPDISLSKGRASMDGQVPEGTTYAEWFAKQSAARQDEIVGPTRGKMYRAGKVSFDRFTNNKGQWLTLVQLEGRA